MFFPLQIYFWGWHKAIYFMSAFILSGWIACNKSTELGPGLFQVYCIQPRGHQEAPNPYLHTSHHIYIYFRLISNTHSIVLFRHKYLPCPHTYQAKKYQNVPAFCTILAHNPLISTYLSKRVKDQGVHPKSLIFHFITPHFSLEPEVVLLSKSSSSHERGCTRGAFQEKHFNGRHAPLIVHPLCFYFSIFDFPFEALLNK